MIMPRAYLQHTSSKIFINLLSDMAVKNKPEEITNPELYEISLMSTNLEN
jgi:hypothetical protein